MVLEVVVDALDLFPELFQRYCVKCHGADGTGGPARDRLPGLPDFTKAAWQARRSDAQLLVSILDGKGTDMPPWRGKVSDRQARDLVTHVRSFAPATDEPGPETPPPPPETEV